MKQIIRLMTVVFAVALAVAGCRREMDSDPSTQNPDGAVGYLSFAGSALDVEWSGEHIETRGNEYEGSFLVDIVNAETGSVAKHFERYDNVGSEPIALPLGKYYIKASSSKEEMKDVAYEEDKTQPIYVGESPVFSIAKEHTKSAPQQAGKITCTMTAVKITVSLKESLATSFEDVEIAVTLAETHTLEFNGTGSHRYGIVNFDDIHGEVTVVGGKNATIGYLKPVYEENELVLELTGRYNGAPESTKYTIDITGSAKAGEWRKIYLYTDETEEEGGHIVIKAKVEEWVYDEVVDVDVKQATMSPIKEEAIGGGEEPSVDENLPEVAAPGLNFEAVNTISAADFADGEFTGNAEITISTVGTIESFLVTISSDNTEFSEDLESNGLDTTVDLMTIESGKAFRQLTKWGFPTLKQLSSRSQEVTFDIAEFFNDIYLYEESGNYSVAMKVSDNEDRTSEFKLDISYSPTGGSGSDSGDGPTIEWIGYDDFDKVYEIDDTLELKIKVTAPDGGIQSFVCKFEKEIVGTLEEAGVETEFDICNLTNEDMQYLFDEVLHLEYGYPAVQGKTEHSLDVSAFLAFFPEGESHLTMEVTDYGNHTTIRTIKLIKND